MNFDKSIKLYEEAKKMVPGGVSSGIRQTEWPVPLFFDSAKGSKMRDVDGNEFIDYVMGMGPNLFGHAPEFITKAVYEDMQNGFCLTGQSEKENDLSVLVRKALPFDFQVRYASSGTEIDQLALRLARAIKGKNKYIKFEGHYHGWMDSVLYNTHPEAGGKEDSYEPVGESLGMSQGSRDEVIIAPWNDLDYLEYILKNNDEISSIIMEPILWNSNVILPKSGYLEGVRELCNKYEIILIFDEVGTGFRVAFGGAQELYRVKPDIATYAKAMAGGFPIAMIAANSEIMEGLTSGEVVHGGSFNSNVMSVSAAHAGLTHIINSNSDKFYKDLNGNGEILIQGLRNVAKKQDIEILIQGFGSFFYLSFTSAKSINNYREHMNNVDLKKYKEFAKSMLVNGIRLSQNGRWHLSSAHSLDDINRTIQAAEKSFSSI